MDVHKRTVTCKAHIHPAPTAPAQLVKKPHREELQLSLSPRNQKPSLKLRNSYMVSIFSARLTYKVNGSAKGC